MFKVMLSRSCVVTLPRLQTLFICRNMAGITDNKGRRLFTNRLIREKSPYLLQHAHNPVDWYPWGEEALQKAKEDKKLIFLSVGYSTCHWCHVMERESFESEEVGDLMNKHFINIKVDREERPDVDKIYMTFLHASTGSGGWPMSVWLTPDLVPFVGGTYFPPDGRYYNKPGFQTILTMIKDQWQEDPGAIQEQGTKILDALLRGTVVRDAEGQGVPGSEAVRLFYNMLEKGYDPDKGGFSKAPKFPQPANLLMLLRLYGQDRDSEQGQKALSMVTHTLTMMAKGGIHDHVAQGFHRYSTDDAWHVPHFEKMLYDQGQLAVAYADAYQITKDEDYADVLKDILLYVDRDLSDKEGGFYSAEDADSYPTADNREKKEGAFCVWTHQQVRDVLSGTNTQAGDKFMADLFSYHYDVRQSGNVDPYQDPHDELKEQNVLIVRRSVSDTAARFNLDVPTTTQLLAQCRHKLYEVHKHRPAPHLDSKMITSWNGLMMSGFAKASQVLGNETYIDRAKKAACFIKQHLYNPNTGHLLRSVYAHPTKSITQIGVPIEGFTDDYANLICGLLDLYEACHEEEWLEWAEELQHTQDQLFWDAQDGGYYTSHATDTSIVLRLKDDQDGAEPSANSVSGRNLVRLSRLLDRGDLEEQAGRLLAAFSERLSKIPIVLPEMMSALMLYHTPPQQIIIVGDKTSEETCAMLRCVHSYYLPNKVVIMQEPDSKESFLQQRFKLLTQLELQPGHRATAYLCNNYTCSLPVSNVNDLQALLTQARSKL